MGLIIMLGGSGIVTASFVDGQHLLCVSPPAEEANASSAVVVDFATRPVEA